MVILSNMSSRTHTITLRCYADDANIEKAVKEPPHSMKGIDTIYKCQGYNRIQLSGAKFQPIE